MASAPIGLSTFRTRFHPILCLRKQSIRPSYVNSLGMTLLKSVKTLGARLQCAEAGGASVHEFAGVPVLSAEHHRLFFYVPHATSPKQVYFSHDLLPYSHAVGFHAPNCFFNYYCNRHSIILGKALYQLASNTWQIHDHDLISRLSVSPACPLTHSSLEYTWSGEGTTSALAEVGGL